MRPRTDQPCPSGSSHFPAVSTRDRPAEINVRAAEVARSVVDAIASDKYDFVLVNFANPDMVGHTGDLPAAIRAVEAVDTALGSLVTAVKDKHGALIVTSDHGNCEQMKDDKGRPHTAHTTNRVPLIYMNDADKGAKLRDGGRISDVAPTMLSILGLEQPAAMTGVSLLDRQRDGSASRSVDDDRVGSASGVVRR